MHALLEAEAAEIVAPDVATEKLTKVIDSLERAPREYGLFYA